MDSNTRPTEDEFRKSCREAFGFVKSYGFEEVKPARYPEDHFQVWYRRADYVLIVRGEGWGEICCSTIEHSSGVEVGFGQLVPKEMRSPLPKNRKKWPGQLDQMKKQAQWLEKFGVDFLSGDTARFHSLARALPPYKKPFV
jgi:hypothetical protein